MAFWTSSFMLWRPCNTVWYIALGVSILSMTSEDYEGPVLSQKQPTILAVNIYGPLLSLCGLRNRCSNSLILQSESLLFFRIIALRFVVSSRYIPLPALVVTEHLFD